MRDFSLHSGERVSTLCIDDVILDHVARYQFATSYLASKNYRFGLDLFCGSGYGTRIMAEKLPAHIVGIDGSLEAIHEASRQTGATNIMYAHKMFPFSLPENWADFIVSYESLEHVENYEAMARMIAAAIKPGGTLIVSAPNEEILSLIQNPYHWHYRHFRPQEIKELFESRGMALKQMLGSNVNICRNKKTIAANFFSPLHGALKSEVETCDTCVYVFEKASP